jgi:hypothetical protein
MNRSETGVGTNRKRLIKKLRSKAKTAVRLVGEDIAKRRAQRWVVRGLNSLARGARHEALKCAWNSLSIYDNLNSAFHLLADVLMPGDDYLALLARLHHALSPEGYVEIGVAGGDSLALAKPGSKAIGIDPKPRPDIRIKALAKLYPITSDQFFAFYNMLEELGTPSVSLAFVDGLHHFEQVLKDIINLEHYSDKQTVVVFHDCLPVARVLGSRVIATDLWCGDVWKVVPCLRKYRPDLRLGVVPTRPSGLGIITNLDATSTVLQDNFDVIMREYADQELAYDYLDLSEHTVSAMVPNVIPNDWGQIAQMLPCKHIAAS